MTGDYRFRTSTAVFLPICRGNDGERREDIDAINNQYEDPNKRQQLPESIIEVTAVVVEHPH